MLGFLHNDRDFFSLLFPFLSDDSLQKLINCAYKNRLEAGTLEFSRKNLENKLFFILTNSCNIEFDRHTIDIANVEFWIGWDTFSELGRMPLFIDVIKDTIVIEFDLGNIQKNVTDEEYHNIRKALQHVVQKGDDTGYFNVKHNIAQTISDYKIQEMVPYFFIMIIYGLCSFLWAEKILYDLPFKPNVTTFYSSILILLAAIYAFIFMRRSKMPISFFGITKDRMHQAIKEGFVFSVLVAIFLVGIKYLIINVVPEFRFDSLFDIVYLLKGQYTTADWIAITFGYSFMVIFQEFVARGFMQKSIEVIFSQEKSAKMKSIFLSNLVFCTVHLQISVQLAVAAFVLGCFWGWMYTRTYNLVGVIISHVILGLFGGRVLGII